MAEFCLSCFNELNGTHYTKGEVWLEEDFLRGLRRLEAMRYGT